MKQYNSLNHSVKDCRNDHPTLNKVPVGFMGFHIEDYEEINTVQSCSECEHTHNEDICLCAYDTRHPNFLDSFVE